MLKIVSGSIVIERTSLYYRVKFENGSETTYFPYIESVPEEVLEFFKKAYSRHDYVMRAIWDDRLHKEV